MKILYVGDNRIRGNYGCRATSTALSFLVREKNTIIGRVSGQVTCTFPGIVYFKYMPGFVYEILSKFKYWDKMQPFFSRVFFKVACAIRRPDLFDFVSHDMDKSIRNLKRCLPANKNLVQLNIDQYDFDAIVVNGEGSFIFCTPQWREPLVISMCIYWALKRNKKVYFMNAMFSDKPNNQRNEKTIKLVDKLLSQCKVVVVREEMSFNYAKANLPSVHPVLIPDALFTWFDLVNDQHSVDNGKYYLAHLAENDESYFDQDFTVPYILISGSSSSIIEENVEEAIKAYASLISHLKKKYMGNIFLIQVCEGDYFLNDVAKITGCPIISIETPLVAAAKILANADVYISGRYHPSIMASLGGTPCIFMGSNSHKTWSIQQLLNYKKIIEFSVIPCEDEINNIIDMALSYIDNKTIRNEIKQRSKALANEAIMMKQLVV